MKESAGEANMTVITIVLIGLVAAAGALLIPNLLNTMKLKSCCTQAGGVWSGNSCGEADSVGNEGSFDQTTYDICVGDVNAEE